MCYAMSSKLRKKVKIALAFPFNRSVYQNIQEYHEILRGKLIQ